jgi:hypothetical protein
MTPGRCLLLVATVATVMDGCRDVPATKGIDSTNARRELSTPITGLGSGTGWDSTAGRVLIIAVARAPADVAVVLPGLTDSTLGVTPYFELAGLANTPVELFGSRGLVGTSTLHISPQPNAPAGCVNWPAGKLADPVPAGWRIALEKGRGIGLPMDSIEGMNSADSAKFVANVVKAARSLTDSSDPVFRGIPFFVRKGYRLETPSSSVIIGEAVRKINEEANPREEHIILLAERVGTQEPYTVGFHARSAGAEESLETSEVLAAVQLRKTERPAIVITFDYEDGGKVGLLERLSKSNWRVVWKSAYTGC